MQPEPSIADIGLTFAKALVAGDYVAAHGMLSDSLRREVSPSDLQSHYELMVSYTDAPPDTIKVGRLYEPMESDGIPDALGWAFVNIDCLHASNDCCLEEVGVLVVNEGSRHVIRQILWGRP